MTIIFYYKDFIPTGLFYLQFQRNETFVAEYILYQEEFR
jgi:hypothetical protein